VPLLRYRVDALRVSGCGGISSSFLLPLLVRPPASLATLLTCVLHCLELIVPPAASSASLGMPLGNFLYPGTDPPLDCPHHLALIEGCSYLIGAH